MARHKNKGMLHGIRPKTARANFAKGDPATKAASDKGNEANRRKWARIRTLRDAAEAIRGMPQVDRKGNPTGFSEGVAATLAMYKAAQDGDPKAYKVLAELMGEMEQKIAIKELPKLIDDI